MATAAVLHSNHPVDLCIPPTVQIVCYVTQRLCQLQGSPLKVQQELECVKSSALKSKRD